MFSSGPAAGVKALRGAIILVVRIIESLTTSSEEVEWGSGVNVYVDKGTGWIRGSSCLYVSDIVELC